MKEERILISSDGPDCNVLKFKPPMVFNKSDVDRLVIVLDMVLSEIEQEAKMDAEPITLKVKRIILLSIFF